ncbi:MAG: MOSC domain-containing protein [Pyrinomonadaceae bacterium]
MNEKLFEKHLTNAEINMAIEHVLDSPKDKGIIEMIVRRPGVNNREVIESGILEIENGLVGDNWLTRGSSRTDNGLGHPEMQLNLMNYRFALLIAGSRERVPLAGDQLFVDLDLSEENLPPGTRLSIGDAIIKVTTIPHLGCKKFVDRFGIDAMRFANSDFGRKHHLRGINAKVIKSGSIITSDIIRRIRSNRGI